MGINYKLKVFKYLKMTKHTKKVGIVGKYGTRYGASLRKQLKKIEISQRKSYPCFFCGKTSIRRKASGLWYCRSCKVKFAGGAYEARTPASIYCLSVVRRLKEAEAL